MSDIVCSLLCNTNHRWDQENRQCLGEEKGAWLRGRQQDCSPALCDASGPSRSCERRRAADRADLRTAAVHSGLVSHNSANNIG